MRPLLEIAAFGLEAAIMAGKAGADRIELCVDYSQGGLTPEPELIIAAKSQISCPVFVMIRPKPGDFYYSDSELHQMEQEIIQGKECGADGFVFGALHENGEIDEAANHALVILAHPLPCTFHRAFDDLPDKTAGLEKLIQCGFQRVLTSGGPGSAAGHTDNLKDLVSQAAGRIMVMPGGGIRPTNLGDIVSITGATEFHSAAIVDHPELPDREAIGEMKRILEQLSEL